MKAGDREVTAALQRQVAELTALGWYHSIELPSGQVIHGLQSLETLRERVARFPLPQDLSGKRVLDIGAWDGWFTFEMERRGASAVAIDLTANTNFRRAKELVGSPAEYHVLDVLELSPTELGMFDVVLFLGVLYHLKHPLLALERVCAITADVALVESYVSDTSVPDPVPRMEFYEFGELCGQLDNWVGPNTACLLAWCRTAGFARVAVTTVIDNRAHVICHRKWEQPTGMRTPAPYIVSLQNALSLDHVFSSSKDNYVTLAFETAEKELGISDVFPEVGLFGSRPIHVSAFGNGGWTVSFKLPPGLGCGWHDVKLRVRASEHSNVLRIGIDAPLAETQNAEGRFWIAGVADNATWEENLVHIGPNSAVAVWVGGLWVDSQSVDKLERKQWLRPDFEVRLSGTTLPAVFVSEPDARGLVQINALLPQGLELGKRSLQVFCKGAATETVEVTLV